MQPAPPSLPIIDGKYQLVRQLGEGGMGAVYEARHRGTGRRVAVTSPASPAPTLRSSVVADEAPLKMATDGPCTS